MKSLLNQADLLKMHENGESSKKVSFCEIHGAFEDELKVYGSAFARWVGCLKCAVKKNAEAAAKDEERKAQRIQEEKERQQRIIEKRLNQAGIPLRFRDKSFESYIADTPEKMASLSIARDFSENFEENYQNGMTLILSGKAGTGKSHLAIAIAQSIMPDYTAMYLNALDAVRMIRDTWRQGSEKSELQVLEMLGSVDLLVIDEVGVQYGTDNEQMLMFDIINRRYRDAKPMILLTNLGTDGFKEYLTERSYDRLRENGKWVSFDWDSYRGKAKV